MRVLLSEASSLTAREHLSVLGPAGADIGIATSNSLAIARFSRWCRRMVRVPRSADDPNGYLAAIAAALRHGGYDAVLPTHEQAWLFAAGRHLLPADAPLAVADISSFDRIQGKLACCRLLDEIGLPQPAWSVLATADDARPGVRTHSSLALMLGAAERTGSRSAAMQALAAGLGRRGGLRGSREVLTPLPADPPSLIPVLVVASQLMLQPGRARALAAGAVRDYAVPPRAVDAVRA